MIESIQNIIELLKAHEIIAAAIGCYAAFLVWVGWMIWAAPRGK